MAERDDNIFPALTSGQLIDNHRIEKKIGSGGMGDVYLATDQRLNRSVAIKTLQPEFFDDADKTKRFTREAVTAAKINHPNIMSIYDVGQAKLDSGHLLNYIVMEYIDGQILNDYVRSNNPAFPDLLRICEKLGSALAAAHKLGIVHRDIKMGNVMINADGEPKILDFGLAKPITTKSAKKSEDDDITDTVTRELTQESKIIGTVSYMAPEQARGEAVDNRSDIFSFGILMYYLFTGKLPFEGNDRVSTIAKILEAPHEPVRVADESLPSELERIINKCLQKNPGDRYQDTRDLVVDLRSLRRQFDSNISESISGIYESSQAPTKKRTKILGLPLPAAVVVLSVAVLIIGWGIFNLINIFPGQSINIQQNALAILNFENLSDPDDADRYGQILQELVLTDLSDNTPLRLISSQRLFDIQKKLGYSDRNKISRDIASEVAQMAGAGIMLSGNLIEMDESWIITCQLVDVAAGTIIKSHRLEGPDIFNIVDSLSGLVRVDLAESSLPEDTDLSVKDKTSISMDAFRHYLAGVDRLNASEYEKAIAEFEKAVEIDPEFNKAYYKMAIAQWWLDDVASEAGKKSILSILEKERYSSEREQIMARGALALMEKRYEAALPFYQQLTEQYPDDKEAWYGLGEALFHYSSQTKEESLEAFEHAIDLDVGFALAYRHVFQLYFEFRRYDQALEKANNLIEVKPESPAGYRYLATAAIFIGDSAKIEKSIEQALRHHTQTNERQSLYYDLFTAFVHAESLSRALEYAQKLFIRLFEAAKQPQQADSILDVALASNIPLNRKFSMISNLAQSYFGDIQGRQKARTILERGMRMDTLGTGGVIWSAAGQLALVQRDFDLAEQYARESIERDDDDKHDWANNILFESYLHRGKNDEALEFSREWLKKNPQLTSGYLCFIQVYVYSNQFNKADSVLQSATEEVDTDSKRIMLLRNTAVCYRNIGQYEKALDLYNQANRIDSTQLQLITGIGSVNELLGNYNLGSEDRQQ
jgi:serine/threonine protein kinase/predicted Zn-dependent protease